MVEVKQRVSRAVIAAVVVLGSAVASGCSTAEIPGMADVLDLPADGSHVLTSGEDWNSGRSVVPLASATTPDPSP